MPQVRNLIVQSLSRAEAELISRWQYEGPYAVYNGQPGRETESADFMLDSRNGFHAVYSPSELVGFCSYGVDGRVPGGVYDDDGIDVGGGMNPSLVGRGHGRAFLGAVVDYATVELGHSVLRATIASWNVRALRTAQGVGFRPVSRFRTDKGAEFTILLHDGGPIRG